MCSEINVSPELGINVNEIADNQMHARVYEFQSALGGRWSINKSPSIGAKSIKI